MIISFLIKQLAQEAFSPVVVIMMFIVMLIAMMIVRMFVIPVIT